MKETLVGLWSQCHGQKHSKLKGKQKGKTCARNKATWAYHFSGAQPVTANRLAGRDAASNQLAYFADWDFQFFKPVNAVSLNFGGSRHLVKSNI